MKKLIRQAFIEGYKQRAKSGDLIFDNTSKIHAKDLFKKWFKGKIQKANVINEKLDEIIQNTKQPDRFGGPG